ncbi:MAG TPA: site-2 protease family protein [Thermoflexales bacterium]|nr:site-2 protease family protein [Thermoflexales bacterium]
MGFIQLLESAVRSGDQMRVLSIAATLLILLLICFPVHEFAHAWTATKLGDDTARLQGRLTLNPIKHLDVVGTLMMMFLGLGWAKPVPVNPMNLRGNYRTSMAIVALAGPVSNFLLAVLFGLIFRVLGLAPDAPAWLQQVCVLAVFINLSLMLFNLIPIPPLDGSKILWAYLPPQMDGVFAFISQYGFLILFGLSYLIPTLFSSLISRPSTLMAQILLGY